MRVLVAPDSFKESLSARDAAEAIRAGVLRARPDASVTCVPMADGGEGTLAILAGARQGRLRQMRVADPLGRPIVAPLALLDGAATAVIELAQVAGLQRLVPSERDPLRTTTLGVGQAIRAALDSGVDRVIVALGGSATVDGGAGLAQALGVVLLDRAGRVIPPGIGGGRLRDVARLDASDLYPAALETAMAFAVDVLCPLTGPRGAASLFAPQKGADARAVAELEAGLSHWADLLAAHCGRDARNEPGAGAAGGAALPMVCLCDAELSPGVDLVIQAVGLKEQVARADVVITGEGRLDEQSRYGKVVSGVARLARSMGVRCFAVAGGLGPGHERCDEFLDGYATASEAAGDAAAARADAARWVATAAERLMGQVK